MWGGGASGHHPTRKSWPRGESEGARRLRARREPSPRSLQGSAPAPPCKEVRLLFPTRAAASSPGPAGERRGRACLSSRGERLCPSHLLASPPRPRGGKVPKRSRRAWPCRVAPRVRCGVSERGGPAPAIVSPSSPLRAGPAFSRLRCPGAAMADPPQPWRGGVSSRQRRFPPASAWGTWLSSRSCHGLWGSQAPPAGEKDVPFWRPTARCLRRSALAAQEQNRTFC